MSQLQAQEAYVAAKDELGHFEQGSAELAQVILAMALAAHAIALYDNADAFRPE